MIIKNKLNLVLSSGQNLILKKNITIICPKASGEKEKARLDI